MKDKVFLLVFYLIIIFGLIKFDLFIYPTLDYFGKFVFVGILNIIPFWIVYEFYNKSKILAFIISILFSIIFYFMG